MTAMVSALTIAQKTADAKQHPTPRQLLRRARQLGWSQNSLARRSGKDTGFVSKLLRREVSSPGAYGDLIETVETGETTGGKQPHDPGPQMRRVR